MGALLALALPLVTHPAAAQDGGGEAWRIVRMPQSSLVFARDGSLIAELGREARTNVALKSLPKYVPQAFVAVEDKRFYQHDGVDIVGVGGAVLAVVLRGREPGRLLLAAICGFAGFAFGAWMDLYQLTLAAHQDLDSYLALATTSLPYNLAHAIGNVVFCLLIGPVFIRSLRRYRRRLEVRWPAPAGAAATLALALLLLVPAAAGAASPADRAEHWLAGAQNGDGGFGAAPAQASSRLYSGWAGLGLAAAGHNPRDLHRRGGRSLAAYVARDGRSVRDIGEVERTVLLLSAAGASPRDFGGRDLVDVILRARRGDGSIAGFVSYTTFGVLALRSAGVSPGRKAVAWLVSSQNPDGGFGVAPASSSDSDMTGAALQALAVVGRQRVAAARRAVTWLRANQNDDGGFGQFRGRSSNAQSTAYAVQGLVAVGAGGGSLSRALGYLRRLQRADGSVAYSSASNQTPVWVTAQALMALERRPLPIAAVPRVRKRRPKAAVVPTAPAAKPPAEPKPKPKRSARHRTAVVPGPEVAPAPRPGSALSVDRANRRDERGSDLPWWAFVLAGLATLALLVALRRRLIPQRLRRRGPSPLA
jgi:hypothetical protein